MRPVSLLFTGFEPFGGEAVNPSWAAVERLPERIGGASIRTRRLPVAFERAGALAIEAIEALSPDAVVCVGQAGGRTGISVERVALNLDDASAPDNEGCRPVDAPIRPDGPCAYLATLPVKRLVSALTQADIPAHISNSAGTYVCNHELYSVLDWLYARRPDVRAGFLHVPYLPEQCGDKPSAPALPLETMVRALEIVARTLADGGM